MTRSFATIPFITAASLAVLIWMKGEGNFSQTARATPSITAPSITTRSISGNPKSAHDITRSFGKQPDNNLPLSLPLASGSELGSTSTRSSPSNRLETSDESTTGSAATLTSRNGKQPSATSTSSANAATPGDPALTGSARDQTTAGNSANLAVGNSSSPPSSNPVNSHQPVTRLAEDHLAIGSEATPAAPKHHSPQPVLIPAALHGVDAADLILTPSQWHAVDQTVDQFVEWIGGENQDPADPGYLDRWQQSQPQADALLKARIGWQAFDGIQASAARKANEQLLFDQTP